VYDAGYGRRAEAGDRDHRCDSRLIAHADGGHLFGTPQGSPRTDRLIAASIQWAERIMQKIDDAFGNG